MVSYHLNYLKECSKSIQGKGHTDNTEIFPFEFFNIDSTTNRNEERQDYNTKEHRSG